MGAERAGLASLRRLIMSKMILSVINTVRVPVFEGVNDKIMVVLLTEKGNPGITQYYDHHYRLRRPERVDP